MSRPDPNQIRTQADFAEALAAARRLSGLSIRDAARALHGEVSFTTVGGWLNGRHLPTPKLEPALAKLLRVFGIADPADWLAALARVRSQPGPRPLDRPPPYRGLQPYRPEDAAYFRGRAAMTAQLMALVERNQEAERPTIVIGASGVGKSSLLLGGLVPALDAWNCRILTPGVAPVEQLAAELAGLDGRTPEELAGALRADPQDWKLPDDAHVLIVVDQLEELFAAGVDEALQRAFLATLCGAPAKGVRVVLSMRADFYQHALRAPELLGALQHGQLVVGPMTDAELRQCITEPAQEAGLTVQAALVEVLLDDLRQPRTHRTGHTHYEPGALPLLSHALLTTWEQTGGRTLTLEQYRSTGGISGAVAKSADQAYTGLADRHERRIARDLFLRMVRTDDEDDVAPTRRKLFYEELLAGRDGAEADTILAVLDRFARARLVTLHDDCAEITHEVLLTAWPKLTRWLEDDAAWRRLHHRLTGQARTWQDTGREDDMLLRGGMLGLLREQTQDRARLLGLSPLEREFLDASAAARDDEQRRTRRRLQRRYQLLALLTVLVLTAVSGLAAVYRLQIDHRREQAQALSRLVAANSDRLRSNDTALAAQLAAEAYRISPTPQARSSLLSSTDLPAVTRLRGPSGGGLLAIALSGSLLAATDLTGQVDLWTVTADGRFVPVGRPLGAGSGPYTAVAFGHRMLAAAGVDGIHRWQIGDPARPVPLRTLTGPRQRVASLAFTGDGRTLAAGGLDPDVYVWHLDRGGAPVALAATGVHQVAFTPDGRTLAAGGEDELVHLWSLGTAVRPLPSLATTGSRVFALAISPDGRRLAAGLAAAHDVLLWDITDPAHAHRDGPALTGPGSWVNAVGFSPDGRTVAAGSSDGFLWLFDAATRQPLRELPHPQPVLAVVYHGPSALLTSDDDTTLREWQLPGPLLLHARDGVFAVGFDPGGRRLAVSPGADDDTLQIWTVADRQHPALAGPPATGAPGKGAFSGSGGLTPDGRVLAVGDRDGSVQFWDIGDPAHPARIGGPVAAADQLVEGVAFSPDGRLLAAGADDDTVRLLDARDLAHPRLLTTLRVPGPGAIYQAAFDPTGSLLAAAAGDEHVYLWQVRDPARPRLLARLGGFASAAYAIAFTGRLLAAGSADGTVRVWDITDPRRPAVLGGPLIGPVGYVYSLAFAPRSQVLAVSSTDGTVWLWNLADPARPAYLATLTTPAIGPGHGILAVAFSPDGHTLATGSTDHSVRLFDTDPAAVTAAICATSGRPISPAEWRRYIPGRAYTPLCHARS